MKKKGLSRRSFISLAAAGTGGMVFLVKCSNPQRYSLYRVFTESEANVVDAIADQIIPPGEWPGGKEAGVTYYIDKQLFGNLARFRKDYERGLAAIQKTCKKLYASSFGSISFEKQNTFLKTMEAGAFSKDPQVSSHWENAFDRSFFNLIRDHAMQGFYGSPRHGGNINHVSYRMIGLDYPLIIGQNRFKEGRS
jgi:gluconate 2-dehydrogenase gamma chain